MAGCGKRYALPLDEFGPVLAKTEGHQCCGRGNGQQRRVESGERFRAFSVSSACSALELLLD